VGWVPQVGGRQIRGLKLKFGGHVKWGLSRDSTGVDFFIKTPKILSRSSSRGMVGVAFNWNICMEFI
jgi:hypothetical protein